MISGLSRILADRAGDAYPFRLQYRRLRGSEFRPIAPDGGGETPTADGRGVIHKRAVARRGIAPPKPLFNLWSWRPDYHVDKARAPSTSRRSVSEGPWGCGRERARYGRFRFARRGGRRRRRAERPGIRCRQHLTALPAQFFQARTDYHEIVSGAGAGHVSSYYGVIIVASFARRLNYTARNRTARR
jgi:hypothetical protein